ncbi:MAG TPA: tRNA (guanosine(37)-N1)-methyltransferase TrmD [Candidatus Monoglobus merdigallinarum]|uniref:tRNA (guanine-N(1)-)-methyltransferase n=1 Tax=Candidatus Monoglobus merdigallinarum TaxID=2838698 RepID=A0A9D1TLK8_9FIRM|nr:tRNA (guanosine(37)-N1)-methyltransferase TrmD [Candidatus Monoglobus merdigallinarum]
MRFDILTLFPEMLEAVLGSSIIGRAQKNGLAEINYVNIRDFAFNKHRRVDDYPYGGGQGMVMQAEPIYLAYQSVADGLDYKPYTIYMSPQGKTFTQGTAKRLAKKYSHIVLLCGHYEGVDQRVLDEIVDAEISIGDFVLTGGEIAAMAVVDAVVRLLPGVLKSEEAFSEESHYSGLLEFPQYTRPEVWRGRAVPEILLSGHHKNIENWKREMSIINTFKKRRGMLRRARLSENEREFAEKLKDRKD